MAKSQARNARRNAAKSKGKPTKKKPTRDDDDDDDDDQPEFDNNLRGVLFKNKRKKKKAQPDFTGSAEIDGVEYWLSGWSRKSKSGNSFVSLAFTVKDEVESEDDDDEPEDESVDLPF